MSSALSRRTSDACRLLAETRQELEVAQGLTDVLGRANSRGASKESNKAKLQEQTRAHPEWNYDNHADALGVARSTVGDYLKEIRTEAEGAGCAVSP